MQIVKERDHMENTDTDVRIICYVTGIRWQSMGRIHLASDKNKW